MEIGASLFDADGANLVPEILTKAKAKDVIIHLPVDYVCGQKPATFPPSDEAVAKATDDASGIPSGWMGFDVGPKSNALFSEVIGRSSTIIWNGPPGVFESKPFATGTKVMADAVAAATARGAITVVGGGDTATAAKKFGVVDKVTHASTGGGASLELLEGKTLPGVAALSEK
jgi:phosphoglycerate kinase